MGDHGGGQSDLKDLAQTLDTSEMMYLGGNQGWVREEQLAHSLGDNNGIIGDARRSTAQLGKRQSS